MLLLDWRDLAACAGSYDHRFLNDDREEQQQARTAYCLSCVVTRECAAYADWMRERYGVWGGESRGLRGRRKR
jgi:hypothetical protein